jgi:hypothetical protein
MNGFYLAITTLFLFFPIIVFLYNKNKNILETGLALLLIINIILSFLFWMNPIEKSLIHVYDGIFAKISFVLFTIYILFIKDIDYKIKLISVILLLLTSIMFYYSTLKSKNWCSKQHLVCHSIFHFLSSVGCSIAFI